MGWINFLCKPSTAYMYVYTFIMSVIGLHTDRMNACMLNKLKSSNILMMFDNQIRIKLVKASSLLLKVADYEIMLKLSYKLMLLHMLYEHVYLDILDTPGPLRQARWRVEWCHKWNGIHRQTLSLPLNQCG